MQRTKIEYLTHTWNPLAMRCTSVSDGCRNCWHLAMAKRLAKNPSICLDERLAYGNGAPLLKHRELEAPLHLKKSSRIGVQFMGDLFHKDVSDGFLFSIFGVMASEEVGCHSFFVLTKRPERMAVWLNKYVKFDIDPSKLFERVWLGVSVEDQKTYDERASILSRIECSHRFISVEPMLGPIVLELLDWRCEWIICGGETGPHARPLHPDWVRSLRDQSQAAGVPFFFKSWGEWMPDCLCRTKKAHRSISRPQPGRMGVMFKCGKKNAGRLLDGREYSEIPR